MFRLDAHVTCEHLRGTDAHAHAHAASAAPPSGMLHDTSNINFLDVDAAAACTNTQCMCACMRIKNTKSNPCPSCETVAHPQPRGCSAHVRMHALLPNNKQLRTRPARQGAGLAGLPHGWRERERARAREREREREREAGRQSDNPDVGRDGCGWPFTAPATVPRSHSTTATRCPRATPDAVAATRGEQATPPPTQRATAIASPQALGTLWGQRLRKFLLYENWCHVKTYMYFLKVLGQAAK